MAAGGYGKTLGVYRCVGGASVFYGGVAMRMREADFEPDPEIDGESGARWPYRYADLEPFYTEAESLLSVAGTTGEDPTEPPRSAPYPRPPGPLAPISSRIVDAARALGLRPFRLPLAINYQAADARTACVACGTCDGFACAIQAKNDVSVILIPRLQQRGLTLRHQHCRLSESNTAMAARHGRRVRDRRSGGSEEIHRAHDRCRGRRAHDAETAARLGNRGSESGGRTPSAGISCGTATRSSWDCFRLRRRPRANSTSRSAFTTTTSGIRRSRHLRDGWAAFSNSPRPSRRSCATICRSDSAA